MTNPLPDAYWVHPQHLLAGGYPGAPFGAIARARITCLVEAGVGCFLDLTAAGELGSYAELLPAGRVDYQRLPLPLPTADAPGFAEMQQALDTLDGLLYHYRHRAVYVHCSDGIERTGALIGCYLVRCGMPGKLALAHLGRLRRECASALSPRNPLLRRQVLDWQAAARFTKSRQFEYPIAPALCGEGG